MLTSQGEVDERLSKMKEAFLKSLEGLGGGTAARQKEKEKTSPTNTSSSKTPSTVVPLERTSASDSPTAGSSGQDNSSPLASRGMNLGYGFPSREQPLETGPYGYSPSGIRRGRYASTSSSILGSSAVGMSQGSEEVIGRMELYDERRRTGYQG